ncbi:TonB-dependent receptor [Gracilimonas mengyeensis]|uniref:Outer membrane receptor proteins, mostly Fe transport n=1 Tax=Gracilimonas mengyeensis TaxID=1302730 RepID=A0A521DUR5_9BACT|nr:TonB-dependent receptor [Gracilimonas mengyeensis]SMO75454.1 Outer membrane receptor proteins, mostly Fe transport [Gracilimonas mengyeensis]
MHRILYALFIVLPLLGVSEIQAQTQWAHSPGVEDTASVDGVVRDALTGETLIGAHIKINRGYRGTATDPSGSFSISQLEPGTYTFICSYVGYKEEQLEVTLYPDQTQRIYIELQPSSSMMEEVVIRSQAQKTIADIGMARMDAEMINRLPSAFEADLFRSLQHLPGVKAASDFSSGLHIRGGSPDQTLILLDETPVYSPSHFFGFYSTFNPDVVGGVQLYKGNYPTKYGGRLGSVLAVENKRGARDEFGGKLSIGMLATRLSVSSPYSKGSWMLAIRRSTLEPMLAAMRENVEQIPDAFYFYDVNGKLTHDISPEDKLTFSIYSGKDQVRFPLATEASLELDYGNQTASGKWTHLFNNKTFSELHMSFSRYYNRPVNSVAGTNQGLQNYIRDYSVSQKVYYISGTHQLETGIKGGVLEVGFGNKLNDEILFERNTNRLYGAWYLQHKWEATEHWTFTSGVRLNGFSHANYLKLNPRIKVNYHVNTKLQFELAYGKYDQFLSQTSNQISGFNIWLSSGESVQPASGTQYLFGVKTNPFTSIGFNVEAYYRTMENLFELDPFIPDMAGLEYHELFKVGDGRAYGIEVMLEKQAGRLNGYIGYNWSKSNRRYPDINGGRFYPTSYNRDHEINIVLNYKLSDSWTVTSTFNYATGQPYTEPAGHRRRSGSIPAYGNTVVLIVNEINGARLPDYHRMDVGITKYGSFMGADSKLSFQVVNAYSRRNVWHQQYGTERGGRIVTSQTKMLPVLPAISYTISF